MGEYGRSDSRGVPDSGIEGLRPEGSSGRDAQDGAGDRRTARVAVPNHDKLNVGYEIVDADGIQPSHLPLNSFEKNSRYTLENERRYHDEPAGRDKVNGNAFRLDPDLLLDAPDANQGAPIVDHEGNVLGGNGRAMSILTAYASFPERGEAYKAALAENAERLGLDPADVAGMQSPMLIRRLEGEPSRAERQKLVSLLNEDFTYSREKRADSKSRGDRFSGRSLQGLAQGLRDADSLRAFFDTKESARLVEMLLADGVIQNTERTAYIGADGLLNPDGKTLVEGALRGRVVRSYETLAKLPADIVGKLDAAIPHILIAEDVGGAWNITEHVRDAVDMLAEYAGSGQKDPGVYLRQVNMITGKAPSETASRQAQVIFRAALNMKKGELTQAFGRHASSARISEGGLVPKDAGTSFNEAFGVEGAADKQAKPGGRDKGPRGGGGGGADVLHSTGSTTTIPIDPNKPAMPQGELRAADATKISDIISALGTAFDVPIRIGKFRDKALGIYKPDAQVVRVDAANNIKTVVHENGHHLQNILFGEISWKPLAPFRKELTPIATKPKSGQSPLPEGFAEFVAKYVVDPAEAQRLAPNFFAHFESLMDAKAPELKAALLQAREGVKKWAEQPAAQVTSISTVADMAFGAVRSAF